MFKIFVLLVCQDPIQTKAVLLTKLIKESDNKDIALTNQKLFRATKLFLFFAYFLPKVYQEVFDPFIEQAKLQSFIKSMG